ncbi:hypothetical protein A8709_08620 [Paenibacillus pectinilyticus]|uniref:HTH tetR-type domain-containing protein n=2 Tax=Paenibacillus pectinilyticus TaxID=512399 RepID=A0A1C1A860_9BACL|nr:hypothetical protein A8709_08620 [Paenibacillus pectinilyticus]
MTEKSQRLDLRIIRTRQLIENAFIDLLQEIELEKITVYKLAERATINRVTFYLHYRDIPDMIDKMAEEMSKNIKNILKAEIPEFTHSRGYRLVKLLEHLAENSKFYTVLLASNQIPVFTKHFINVMLEDITEKIGNQSANPIDSEFGVPADILLWYSASAFIGAITSWLRSDMSYTPKFLAKKLLILAPFASYDEVKTEPKS